MNKVYPTNRYTGARFKSKEFRAWESQFTIWALSHHRSILEARQVFSKPPKDHYVHIHCEYYFHWERIFTKRGTPQSLDTSNRIKILHDAIAKAIWCDDKWFFDGSFIKRPTKEVGEYAVVVLSWFKGPWVEST